MIYLRNSTTAASHPMKKVGEIEYREILPKRGPLLISRVIHDLETWQFALVGVPFTESYDVNARVKVALDGIHAFTLVKPHDRVWSLNSDISLHAYEDERPVGAFAINDMKVAVEWLPIRDAGVEVECGIRIGIYEKAK